MTSMHLGVGWRPRPFFHMEVLAMASLSQPCRVVSRNTKAFQPDPNPVTALFVTALGTNTSGPAPSQGGQA